MTSPLWCSSCLLVVALQYELSSRDAVESPPPHQVVLFVAAHLAVSRIDFVAAKGANKPFQQTTVAHIMPFGHSSGLNAGLLGVSRVL